MDRLMDKIHRFCQNSQHFQ